MGATEAILIAVAIGSLILSQVLMKQAKTGVTKQNQEFDNSIATFASRNVPLPYVIGRRTVGATVVSVWGRVAREERVTSGSSGGGGKGGGGGGGSDTYQTIYYENAVHFICLGPCTRLRAIYQNGEKIWEGAATPDDDQSFSDDLGEDGAFKFYFGYPGPRRSHHRVAGSGEVIVQTENRWIVACRWINKRLGPSPDWPQIEYEIECFDESVRLLNSNYVTFPPGGDPTLDRGVNAAHAIYKLLKSPFPHGRGFDDSEIGDTLENLGQLCEAEGLVVNLLIVGETLREILADILSVIGCYMVEESGKLEFIPIRDPGSDIVELGADAVSPPDAEVVLSMSEAAPSRVIMTFPDIRLKYRANGSMAIDDDGQASYHGSYRTIQLTTKVVTSSRVNDIVSRRKLSEAFGDKQTITVTALHGAHLISPGRAVDIAGIGLVRVTSTKLDPQRLTTRLEVLVDSYGVPDTDDHSDDPPPPASAMPAEEDLYVNWFEVPDEEALGRLLLVVFRIRAHTQIIGANVMISVDGGTYYTAGQQNTAASGGPIRTGIDASDPDVIENGPIVDPLNTDIDIRVLDLSSDVNAWQGGKQLCCINNEVFFLRNIDLVSEVEVQRSTAYSVGDYVVPPASYPATGLRYKCITAGTTDSEDVAFWPENQEQDPITDGTVVWQAEPFAYQLKGLIRARFETTAATHAPGSVVAIIERSDLVAFTDVRLGPGVQVCVKTQPYTTRETLDPSVPTPVCKNFVGDALGDLYVTPAGEFYVTPTGEYYLFDDEG